MALYRRYRPETFAEVIGQSHVTDPLRHALANNRVNHAYLFSGPRGCGKTTSARILARALNCEKAPVADPCGECQSCRDLARGGPGSLDVIEIDAASHGGVDDARDLRERAFFAPVNSRYKVYIIDEAHMVSSQGFNALLKLVEEPPPHLKFIFATTEPEKVIGTIRSRTHHYPFRLVPPKTLTSYLEELGRTEGVPLEATALPLIVRAGGGSVRDTLSVLDQLIAGASDDGVTYDLAASLLGYTPDSLLDEVIDAFAAGDGGAVFAAVDKVVETGQDPRRFAEDLLQRLRDLVIVANVPDAIGMGLIDIAGDRGERIENQAARFGRADLTRAADVVSAGLTELRGATAPRLLLELMCARILLPGADATPDGVQARLDRIERRLSIVGDGPPPVERPAPAPAQAPASTPTPAPTPTPTRTPAPAPAPTEAARPAAPAPAVEEAPPAAAEHTEPAPPGTPGVADVRRLWPDILDKVRVIRRFTWVMLSQNAQVHSLEGTTLTIGLVNSGARDSFARSGSDAILVQALVDVLGGTWRVEAIVDPSAGGGAAPARAGSTPRGPDESAAPPTGSTGSAPQAAAAPAMPEPSPAPPTAPPPRERASADAIAAARASLRDDSARPEAYDPDLHAKVDDPAMENDGLSHEELLSRTLGAQVISEIPHD
ncbi:DNA polymerase III subunit gamma and tau [Mumia sp. zg.B17]|uniref:DNA polymerase III subunit gamma and tau n=1 Tax=unclassified Mumia TaxID=2621872 RepID=UPI001C6EEADB|nr:DNA polymerase III subunit gamma and tau [Mumia sp. zg.B17]MBW9207475.1 DNA polymerase III subunit gamma and tau [Mumia sp. zg.B17]